ncbi:MAG: M3 family metallopeptidase, partial [Brevinema sp.]
MPRKLPQRTPQFYKGEINPYDLGNLNQWTDELKVLPLDTPVQLEEFVSRINELAHLLKDSLAEIYTQMTCHTDDKELEKKYNAFHQNVIAHFAPIDFELKKRVLSAPSLEKWCGESPDTRNLLVKWLKKDVDFFREENIPLSTKESEYGVKYRSITGGMTVEFQGEEKTLPELGVYLKNADRSVRESAWRVRVNKMLEHKQELNDLFDNLVGLRQQMATNTGYPNYRDFAHPLKGRFSYSVQDVLNFQEAVEEEIVPLVKELNDRRKQELGLSELRPWDLAVSPDGRMLKPVPEPAQLADKGIEILLATDNWTGDNFASMKESGLLDLVNRKNKAPGGYSYPLYKYGASFIFMNAVGIHSDLTTLVHEAGHAM